MTVIPDWNVYYLVSIIVPSWYIRVGWAYRHGEYCLYLNAAALECTTCSNSIQVSGSTYGLWSRRTLWSLYSESQDANNHWSSCVIWASMPVNTRPTNYSMFPVWMTKNVPKSLMRYSHGLCILGGNMTRNHNSAKRHMSYYLWSISTHVRAYTMLLSLSDSQYSRPLTSVSCFLDGPTPRSVDVMPPKLNGSEGAVSRAYVCKDRTISTSDFMNCLERLELLGHSLSRSICAGTSAVHS